MLKKILIGLVTAVLLFVAVAFVLPSKYQVSREIQIDRPPAQVYQLLNSFERFNAWSPWAKLDPNAKYQHEGPQVGIGAKHSWVGNSDVGSGSQEIIASTPEQLVTTKLIFDGVDPATSSWELSPAGNGTRVRWVINGELGNNPVSRWFGLVMDSILGKDFESGLSNMKTLLEAEPVAAAASEPPPA